VAEFCITITESVSLLLQSTLVQLSYTLEGKYSVKILQSLLLRTMTIYHSTKDRILAW